MSESVDVPIDDTPPATAGWREALARWMHAVSAADRALVSLRARAARLDVLSPELRAEHAALMRRVPHIVRLVRDLRDAVDRVRGMLGLWRARVDPAAPGEPGTAGLAPPGQLAAAALAAAPIMPIAALTAATAVLVAFVADYWRFARRADLYEQLLARGYHPEAAALVVERVARPVGEARIAGIPLWLLVGALAVGVWWFSRNP